MKNLLKRKAHLKMSGRFYLNVDKIEFFLSCLHKALVFVLKEKATDSYYLHRQWFEESKKWVLDHWYLPSGARVVNQMRGVFRRKFAHLSKEEQERVWSFFVKKFKDGYEPTEEIEVEFKQCNVLGEGLFEDGRTCFGEGGCNELSRDLLIGYKRAYVLTLKSGDQKRGRCIIEFAGRGKVFLFNFYTKNWDVRKPVFYQAFLKIMNLSPDRYAYTIGEPNLPIYLNNDGIMIYRAGLGFYNLEYPRTALVPCPICLSLRDRDIFYTDCIRDTVVCVCSKDCFYKARERYDLGFERCENCGIWLEEDDVFYSPAGDEAFCESCHHELFTQCHGCDQYCIRSEIVVVEGKLLCGECKPALCELCGEVHKAVTISYRTYRDKSFVGKWVCRDCDDLYVCDSCVYIENDLENGMCEHCRTERKTVCS